MPASRGEDLADDPGHGFPERFRIEVADEPDFRNPRLVFDATGGDYPNPGDNVVTLYTANVAAAIDDLMRYSNQCQAPVEDLAVRHATLEDVFLKLTGRRMRE